MRPEVVVKRVWTELIRGYGLRRIGWAGMLQGSKRGEGGGRELA